MTTQAISSDRSIGDYIRDWRQHRRYSQLALALEIDLSQKHLSFIESGRSILNFSEWNLPQGEGGSEIVEVVREGEMPPFYYAWMPNHPDARLSESEKADFARGLEATLRASPPSGRR